MNKNDNSVSLSSGPIYSCKVRLFRDEESITVNLQKQVTGEWLLSYVCNHLNLVEKYYFGLRYTDQQASRQWIDLALPVFKQIKDPQKDSICFRVRYYPAAPELLKEDLTRYQLYMQLRRDAFHGRLVPRPADVPILSALIMQSELGDCEDLELDDGFTQDVDLLPKLAFSMETEILKSFKELNGLSPSDAETRFIDRVRGLETYGIDPQVAKEKSGQMIHIGANHLGIAVFQSFRRIKLMKWEFVMKVGLDGRTVSVVVFYPDLDEKARKQTNKYKCADDRTAKFLWRSILDQQSFFTLHSRHQAKPIKSRHLFKRTKKYKFSGRCYDEVVDESRKIMRMAPEFVRASSLSLNRSHSIRSFKRHLAPSSKRNSMGSVPHSKSLPVGLKDASLMNNGVGAQGERFSLTLENGEKSPHKPSESGDGESSHRQHNGLNGTNLDESQDYTDEGRTTPDVSMNTDEERITPDVSLDTEEEKITPDASFANTDFPVDVSDGPESSRISVRQPALNDLTAVRTEVKVTVPKTLPLFSSTPVSSKVKAVVEKETTPVYQTKAPPQTVHVVELTTSPVNVATISSGPTRFPPPPVVEVKDTCTLAKGESASDVSSEATLSSHSEESDDDEEEVLERSKEGGANKLSDVEEGSETADDDSSSTAAGEGLLEVVEDAHAVRLKEVEEDEVVVEAAATPVHTALPNMADELLPGEPEEHPLKLDLNQLREDDSSAPSTPTSSSSSLATSLPSASNESHTSHVVMLILLILVVLVIGSYVLFETNYKPVDGIRQMDFVKQIRASYYNVLRDRVRQLFN